MLDLLTKKLACVGISLGLLLSKLCCHAKRGHQFLHRVCRARKRRPLAPRLALARPGGFLRRALDIGSSPEEAKLERSLPPGPFFGMLLVRSGLQCRWGVGRRLPVGLLRSSCRHQPGWFNPVDGHLANLAVILWRWQLQSYRGS